MGAFRQQCSRRCFRPLGGSVEFRNHHCCDRSGNLQIGQQRSFVESLAIHRQRLTRFPQRRGAGDRLCLFFQPDIPFHGWRQHLDLSGVSEQRVRWRTRCGSDHSRHRLWLLPVFVEHPGEQGWWRHLVRGKRRSGYVFGERFGRRSGRVSLCWHERGRLQEREPGDVVDGRYQPSRQLHLSRWSLGQRFDGVCGLLERV